MTGTHPNAGCDDAVELNRRALRRASALAVALCGGPGSGKTALLEAMLRRLRGRMRCGVIVANPTADRDARRLVPHCDAVVPVSAAALDAARLHRVLSDVRPAALDLLFIESIVNPAEAPLDLGQHLRVAVFSVAGGDDKAAEFPRGVADADLVLLNKLDLLPHVRFDTRVFESDIRRLNLDVPVLHVSAAQGTGMEQWERWLRDQFRRMPPAPPAARAGAEWLEPPEVFLG